MSSTKQFCKFHANILKPAFTAHQNNRKKDQNYMFNIIRAKSKFRISENLAALVPNREKL